MISGGKHQFQCFTMEDTKECSPFTVFYGYTSIFSPPFSVQMLYVNYLNETAMLLNETG